MNGGRRTYRPKTTSGGDDESYYQDEEPQTPSPVLQWCGKRSGWFVSLATGFSLLVCAAVVIALVIGGLGFRNANYALVQAQYLQDGRLSADPLSHVLLGTTARTMILPKDLSDFVGRLYNIDCGSAAAHTVVIEPGSTATWTVGTPNIRTATCTAAGGGFSFRVISATGIRLIDPRSVTFTT